MASNCSLKKDLERSERLFKRLDFVMRRGGEVNIAIPPIVEVVHHLLKEHIGRLENEIHWNMDFLFDDADTLALLEKTTRRYEEMVLSRIKA